MTALQVFIPEGRPEQRTSPGKGEHVVVRSRRIPLEFVSMEVYLTVRDEVRKPRLPMSYPSTVGHIARPPSPFVRIGLGSLDRKGGVPSMHAIP